MRSSAAVHPLDDSRPVWQALLVFLIPLMLTNVLQSLSQTVSYVYLGRLVGVGALAAVSAIFPVVFLLISFVIGVSTGSTVLIGQAYGARDDEKLKQVVGSSLSVTLFLSAVVGLFGGFFAEPLLRMMGTPSDILAASTSYSQIVFFAIPVFFVYLAYTTYLRGVGDARTPFYALILSTVLTLALAPACILGWLGLPPMGTNGAAVAGILSNALTFGALLAYLAYRKSPIALDRAMLAHLNPRWRLVWQMVRIGIPTAINLIMVSLSEIAVISFVNRFGSTATAAYGAVNQVVSYVQFPAISIGIAASIFGAQAIGAQLPERVNKVVRAAVALNYIIEGVLIVICYIFSRDIIALFITEPHTVTVAQSLLHITLWSYAIFGNSRVLSGIMLSSGAVIWPTVISIASIWLVEVPVAYVLMLKLGLNGVWYGYPAAFIAGLIMQTAYYKLVWKKRPLVRLI